MTRCYAWPLTVRAAGSKECPRRRIVRALQAGDR
jgi:hypothetical protein